MPWSLWPGSQVGCFERPAKVYARMALIGRRQTHGVMRESFSFTCSAIARDKFDTRSGIAALDLKH